MAEGSEVRKRRGADVESFLVIKIRLPNIALAILSNVSIMSSLGKGKMFCQF